jgi:hypothetical protein
MAGAATTQAMSNPSGRPSRYEAPFAYDNTQSSKDRILGWVQNAIQEGESLLKSNSGYNFIDASRRIMADWGFDELPSTLSKVSFNFVKRDARDLIATLANPRPIASYKSDNQEYNRQVDVLNKCYMAWYMSGFVDRKIRAALQYAAVEGTGYLMTSWDPAYWGPGKGEVELTALGVDQVLPLGISPDNWDLQKAYGVVIRRQVPVVDVIRRYPTSAGDIAPDGESVSWWRKVFGNSRTVSATPHNTFGRDRGFRDVDPTGRAVVTVYDIYLQDAAVNNSSQEMIMGVQGSPWEYKVPFYGQDLPTGIAGTTRKADYHDARVYPYRRHIVCTNRAVLYDGPSKYWHGQVPLVKFTLDDWPFEYCGVPITKEPAKLQAAVTSLLRALDDSENAKLRPPIGYDRNRVDDQLARSFDPRMGGQIIGMDDVTMGEMFKVLLDPTYFQMGQNTLETIQWMRQSAKELIGLPDLQNLQAASQIPSGDTIEKMGELAGPLATDMSRNMEAALRSLAEQYKAMVFEFYSARRRFNLLGPDGLTREDYDYDPANLVPQDLNLPGVLPGATRSERARAHMSNFNFSIVPNSVYGMTQSTRKMLNIQLARMGFPVSPYTVLESCDISNPGQPPIGANTEIEKFWAWKMEEATKMSEIQAAIQQQQMQANPAAAIAAMAQQSMANNGGSNEGRKPSGQVSPHQEVKSDGEGGERVVISES